MLSRGAAKNEAPRRPQYFSARASRAARRRFEDAPRTFGQDWFVIPQGLRTPVRPHGTRQQPRLSCVPIVFDYILIQGCKSKKLCRAASSKQRQIHAAARSAREIPRAVKTPPARRKQKNPFPQTPSRTPRRAALSAELRKIRETDALCITAAGIRTIRARGGKFRRRRKAEAAYIKLRKPRRFYDTFANLSRFLQTRALRRH